MNESRGEIASFGKEEEAYLRDVCSRGDVNKVLLPIRIKLVFARELVQRAINFFEIPRVPKIDQCFSNLSFWRNRGDVLANLLSELHGRALVKEFEAVDEEVVVLAERNGWTPLFPPGWSGATIEHGAYQA